MIVGGMEVALFYIIWVASGLISVMSLSDVANPSVSSRGEENGRGLWSGGGIG